MMPCPTISTERLRLRPFRDDDVDAYFAVLDTPEVRQSLRRPPESDADDAWREMAMWRGQWELRGTGQWAVERLDTDVLIGRAGSHYPHKTGWPGIEIGWTLHPDHWGQGYATEAGQASLDWVFANHPIDEVYSLILEENVASQNVARRLGFGLTRYEVLPFFGAEHHGIWTRRRDP